MKPSKISYSESKESFDISTGLKSWRKAGVEIELDGDDVDKAYSEAKQIVGKALMPFMIDMSAIPQADGYNVFDIESMGNMLSSLKTQPLPTIDYSAKEKVEKAIDNATSDVELMAYINDAITHGLVKQYVAKKQTFEMKG